MKTQGERLATHLKRAPHTYMEMLMLGISTCPQKRVVEWLNTMPKDGCFLRLHSWRLVKGKRGDLITWRIVRAKKA